eukprot:504382_1
MTVCTLDEAPAFTYRSKHESKPWHALSSLTLPILYLFLHWLIILSMWHYLQNSAFVFIILLNMLICAFFIPYRNSQCMEIHHIQQFQSKFIKSMNQMIQSQPQIYQLFYWNEHTSQHTNHIHFKRHHHQEIFDQYVWVNMCDTEWLDHVMLTNNTKCIIIPITLKFSFDAQTEENYERWKSECDTKMNKIKTKHIPNRKWDGIIFDKRLAMDVFQSPHGIHDGETKYICYWKDSYYTKKIRNYCCSRYLPTFFIMNLVFGALGITLFTYFKYLYLCLCVLNCSSFIEYDPVFIHKKLCNIERVKRALILDVLMNDCQANEDIACEIPDTVLRLCEAFTPDCLVTNRIHYESSSHSYCSSYHTTTV